MDWVKIPERMGANSADNSLRMRHDILSGPDAFLTLSLDSNFSSPFDEIIRGAVEG